MKEKFPLIAFLVFIALASTYKAYSFIERKYSLQEVIAECTNIAFGTVESVDKKRKRAIVALQEDVKGKSTFEKIKINIAVGQVRKGSNPDMMMEKFETGLPFILFYRKRGAKLGALGYVSGTWLQMKTLDNPNKDKVWWHFTHIEIHMHRTYKGSTTDFQRLLLPFEYAEPNDVKVLAFTKHRGVNEFKTLSSFQQLANKNLVYKPTQVLKPSDLNKANIVWIGYRSISLVHTGKYLFDHETEGRIKEFVRRGGIVILSGQDSDPKRPCKVGFLPESIKGVEGEVGNGIQVVKKDNLFTTPERIQATKIRVDDAWAEASKNYSVLAKTFDGHIAIAKLNYGKGMYLVTAMQNGRPAHLETNAPLMKNLMYQAVSLIL